MKKSTTEMLIIEKIAKRHNISKSLAKKIYKNTLMYFLVQEQILKQSDFLMKWNKF